MAGITATVDMLAKVLTEIAREVGQMDPDDPLRAERLKELCELTKLSNSPRSELNNLIHKRLGELAHEIRTLEASDPRQRYIASEILRLSSLISE
jgi:hypothetical protein